MRVRGAPERVVGVEDLIQLEPMRDQPSRVDLLRLHGLEKHRCRDRVDQSRRDRDVLRPEPFQVEVDLGAMHANIGDDATGRDQILAEQEGGGYADGLDRRIDAAASQRCSLESPSPNSALRRKAL